MNGCVFWGRFIPQKSKQIGYHGYLNPRKNHLDKLEIAQHSNQTGDIFHSFFLILDHQSHRKGVLGFWAWSSHQNPWNSLRIDNSPPAWHIPCDKKFPMIWVFLDPVSSSSTKAQVGVISACAIELRSRKCHLNHPAEHVWIIPSPSRCQ